MNAPKKFLPAVLAVLSVLAAMPAAAASFKAVYEKGAIVIYATAEIPEVCQTTLKYYTYNNGKWTPDTLRCESNVIAKKNVRFCTSRTLEAERIELDSTVERVCRQ